MLPYSRHIVTEDDIAAVNSVLRSDWLTTGPVVQQFEEALAEYAGARYAVAVNSGTAALMLSYRILFPKTQPLYESRPILTSPLSFVATSNAAMLVRADAKIYFRDVDEATGNAQMSWNNEWIDAGADPWILVPVHYAGRASTITRIAPKGVSSTGETVVVEDACHALGAMDFDGCSRVGSCAHSLATCFSFHPVKPITTGEGGAVTTNDEGLAREIKSLRNHGRDEHGLMTKLGGNYRMSDIQAALGLSQLKRCDEMRVARMRLAALYQIPLEDEFPGLVDPPEWMHEGAWHLYSVRIKNGKRDAVKAYLNQHGIGAQVHYSPIIPLNPYYRERFGYKPGDFPNAEAWAAEELSLPLWAGMTETDVELVVDTLREALVNG